MDTTLLIRYDRCYCQLVSEFPAHALPLTFLPVGFASHWALEMAKLYSQVHVAAPEDIDRAEGSNIEVRKLLSTSIKVLKPLRRVKSIAMHQTRLIATQARHYLYSREPYIHISH